MYSKDITHMELDKNLGVYQRLWNVWTVFFYNINLVKRIKKRLDIWGKKKTLFLEIFHIKHCYHLHMYF